MSTPVTICVEFSIPNGRWFVFDRETRGRVFFRMVETKAEADAWAKEVQTWYAAGTE